MRRMLVLSTALGAALLAAPAIAQPRQSPADQRSNADPVAPLPAQQQAARRLDTGGQREAHGLLTQADQAVSRGDWARANELLERAQTARLNSVAAGGGAAPATAGGDAFERARQAMTRRNASEARQALQSAMNETGVTGRLGRTAEATPGQVPSQPVPQGRGGTPQFRAGAGTAGPTPMDSAAGTATMPNQLQPGTSAAEATTPRGRGAPYTGTARPGAGSGSPLSSGGQIRPGTPGGGGGTGGGADEGS